MYPVLLKFFYLFYYIKKNKSFKFFILLDIIYNLLHRIYLLKRALAAPLQGTIIRHTLKTMSIDDIRSHYRKVKSDFDLKRKILKKHLALILDVITTVIP